MYLRELFERNKHITERRLQRVRCLPGLPWHASRLR